MNKDVHSRPMLVVGGTGLTLACLITLWGFTRYFDVTDEGLILHLLRFGPESSFFTTYHLLFYPLGELFGHGLLLYRILHLILILGVSCYAGYVVHGLGEGQSQCSRSAMIVFCAFAAVSLSFPCYKTLWYSAVTFLGATAWCSGLIAARGGEVAGRIGAAIAGAGAFLAYTGRMPNGILMAGFGGCVLLVLLRRSGRVLLLNLVIYVAVSGVLFGLWTWIHAAQYRDLVEILRVAQETCYKSPLEALGSVSSWGRMVVLAGAYFVLAGVVTRKRPHLASLLCVVLIVCSTALVIRSTANLGRAGCACALVVLLNELRRWRAGARHARPELGIFLLFPAGIVLALLGSGNKIFTMYGWAGILLAPQLTWLLCKLPPGRRRIASIAAAVCLLTLSFRFCIHKSYRSGSWGDNTVACAAPLLRGVTVRQDLANTIQQLRDSLGPAGFDKQHDRLLAYPDLPGLIAAAEVRSYGCAWVFSGYDCIDSINLSFFERTPMAEDSRLWLLLAGPLSDELQAYVDAKFTAGEAHKEIAIGTYWQFREKLEYNVRLLGPYLPKTHASLLPQAPAD